MRPDPLKVLLLTEATAQTGRGHLTRCSALYDAFLERGVVPGVILYGDERAAEWLEGRPATVFDWVAEPERLLEQVDGVDVVVIDSYRAGESLYRKIAGRVALGVYIDDTARISYPPGIVVNGTVGAEKGECQEDENNDCLIGAGYVILRKEFWDVPVKAIREEIEKILVTFGGSDPAGLTSRVVSFLGGVFPGAEIGVAEGGRSAAQMRDAMIDCDLAVSAAGQTVNELARCGVPSLIFQTAGNQRNNIRGWTDVGFIEGETTLESLGSGLDRIRSSDVRRNLSAIGQRSVDGKGARRIVRRILNGIYTRKLTLRPVAERDLMPLFALANDPEVRQNSFQADPIPLCDHKKWFGRMLTDEQVELFIIEAAGDFVGQVRFDIQPDEVVTSLSIREFYRGLGLGSEMLRRAIGERNSPDEAPVTAYIKLENAASRQTFEKAGYRHREEMKWIFEKNVRG